MIDIINNIFKNAIFRYILNVISSARMHEENLRGACIRKFSKQKRPILGCTPRILRKDLLWRDAVFMEP